LLPLDASRQKIVGDEFERLLIENCYSHYRPKAVADENWKLTFVANVKIAKAVARNAKSMFSFWAAAVQRFLPFAPDRRLAHPGHDLPLGYVAR
jgi:hypothetical protein